MKRGRRVGILVALALLAIGAAYMAWRAIDDRSTPIDKSDLSLHGMDATDSPLHPQADAPVANEAQERIDSTTLPARSNRTPQALAAETLPARGWIIARWHGHGERPAETGRITLRTTSTSENPWRVELPVIDGRFKCVAPADERLEVESLELGGRPLATSMQVTGSRELLLFEVHAVWLEPVIVHVVDAESGSEVGGIQVDSADGLPLTGLVIGSGGEAWPESLQAPIKFLLERRFDDRGGLLVSLDKPRYSVLIRAPAHGRVPLEVDVAVGGERTVRLERAGGLRVRFGARAELLAPSATDPDDRDHRYFVLLWRDPDSESRGATDLKAGASRASTIEELETLSSQDQEELRWRKAMLAVEDQCRGPPLEECPITPTDTFANFDGIAASHWYAALVWTNGGESILAVGDADVLPARTTSIDLASCTRFHSFAPAVLAVSARLAETRESIALDPKNVRFIPELSDGAMEAGSLVDSTRGRDGVVSVTTNSGFIRVIVDFGSASFGARIERVVRLAPGNNVLELSVPPPPTGVLVSWSFVDSGEGAAGDVDLEAMAMSIEATIEALERVKLFGSDGTPITSAKRESRFDESFFPVPAPGHYTLRFPDHPLFAGLRPIEFDVPAHSLVEREIELHQ